MAPHPLVEADPAALAIAYLSGHPDVVAALAAYGGAAGRVAGVNRPPYPRVAVADPPAGSQLLTWHVSTWVALEVLGDLDGTPGKSALRRIAMTVVGALAQWPDATFGADDPVITNVMAQLPGWAPLGTGQPRYVSTASVWLHPPTHR